MFKIDSLLIPVSVTLGMIYSGTGKYDEAIVEFRRALKIEPNHAQANRELAKTYELMGKENEAEKKYLKGQFK
ncbi:MAG: tetratricopeptide repeat protein [Ignavibacteriales bacterium]|nr:tetratricopeptide repeat protein [Ignavibacteriales bacterium]